MIAFPNLPALKQKLDDWHTDFIASQAADARALANLHGYPSDTHFPQFNAIEHSYVSAQVTLKYGEPAARLTGYLKETLFPGEPLDSRRDEYNNEVGRRIAQWIELNGYDESVLDDLIMDALDSGKLVTNLADSRIASQPPQKSDWTGPSSWHEPTQSLPPRGEIPLIDDIREAFEDIRRWFEDPWDHAPKWLRDLRERIRDILSDPLVLDLDGDGIEITSLASSTTMFDLDGDSALERTAWVSPHDGLLVQDANGNGSVDGVAELFGSANVDGYDELALLDSNADGRIDSADPAFAQLKVWRDLNSDGVSTPDEILSLADAGIARFNLAYTQTDSEVAGNVVARTGTYVRADGTSRAMASVRFALDETVTLPEIPEDAVVGNLPILPNLAGHGTLADLATAMFHDPVLRGMVEDLTLEAQDFDTFQEFVDGGFADVIYRWAGVDTSVPEDPEQPYYYQVFEAMTGLPLGELNEFQRERLAEIWPETLKQLGVEFLFQAAQRPALQPVLEMLDALTDIDPDDPALLTTMSDMVEAAMAQSAAIAPAYDYLDLFTGLELDVGTREITGDFDAFVARFIDDEPSFFTQFGSGSGGGGSGGGRLVIGGTDSYGAGGASEARHPWIAWYEDHGSLLFNVAAAMGIGPDYVLTVTGWRWLFGEMTDHHGGDGADLLDFTVTYYSAFGSGTSSATHDQLLYGYEGNDELRGNDGVDRLVGGPGNDLLKGGSGSDMYVYAAGDGLDRIVEESGAEDVIYFSSELNSADLRVTRIAGTGDLQLHFGDSSQGIVLANQWSSAAAAVEQFHFVAEDGLDSGDIASLYLATLATAGADSITGSWASERIPGLDGNDTLNGIDGDDTLTGGGGDDVLGGGNGNDLLEGGSGADSLFGHAGLDSLEGGGGNDNLQGGPGADSYVYRVGDGDDYLLDYQSNEGATTDTLVFGEGIAPEDLIFSRVASDWNDIRIGFAGGTGSILIDNQNWGDAGIEAVVFDGGATWNHAQLMARYVDDQQTPGDDVIHGSSLDDVVEAAAGNDVVTTGAGADTLIGGPGSDNLQGGSGSDTYVYNPGDGDDVILDYQGSDWGDVDTLVFGTGITWDKLVFSRVGADWNDIRITFDGLAGSIVIDAQNWNDAGIEAVIFADGTDWDHAELMAHYVAGQQTAGNDTIHGSNLDDTVQAGSGNDLVYAGAGNDVLNGGLGNDRLEGGEGSDTYRYQPGEGDDVLFDYRGSRTNELVLLGNSGLSEILVSRPQGDSSSVRISFKTMTGSVTILNQTWGDAGIETIRLGDGTVLTEAALNQLIGPATNGNDTLAGTAGADTIWTLEGGDSVSGLGGDDALRGQDGNDLLVGGEGSDNLLGGAGDDVLRGDLAGFDALASGSTLLVNGGFEQAGTVISTGSWGNWNSTMPGWTRLNSQNYEQVKSGEGGIWASEGSYWLDLEGGGGTGSNMVISQTVSGLAAGQPLILMFDHANRVNSPSGAFEVWWNGALVMTVPATGKAMITDRLELLAVAGDNLLMFKGIGATDSVGASLDNVRLYATVSVAVGQDALNGGDGADLIDGGGGADLLTGGLGADLFRFDHGDTGLGAGADRITDFLSGVDRIDLSSIDADSGLAGDQAFTFIGASAFGGVAGQLRYSHDGSDTWLEGDTDGDGSADFQIVVGGSVSPSVADFIL